MRQLTSRDARALLDLVGEVGDAESLEEFRTVLLQALRRLVPADWISYNEVLGAGRVLAAIVDPELPEKLLEAWARHAFSNPLVARYAATRDGRAYRFSDFVSLAELRRLPVYTEVYGPLGVRHQIAFALPSPPALVRGIALSRTGRDFTERERELLNLARPYLVQAYRNAYVRGRLTRTVEGLAGALDGLEYPALALNRQGVVVFATPAGADILQALGGAAGAPLPPGLQGLRVHTREPLLVALSDGPAVARLVGSARADQRVIVFERAGTTELDGLAGLGLSPRESAVLREFSRGRTPAQTAAALGISVRTVHKHTQNINAKLGTRDRAQAVATALSALRTSAYPELALADPGR